MKNDISRRLVLQAAGGGVLAALAAAAPAAATSTHATTTSATASLRARFHMTPPAGWLCDPQRPVFTDGAYQLYYLHSDQNNGPGGWDRASTTDVVHFTHHGAAIPVQPGFPVWSGSAVVDTADTAGFGAGAVIALATQPTDGIRKYQEQYLHWSTDGGATFTALPDPVIVNTDGRSATTPAEIDNAEWFRDPKVHWDSARGEWVCVIGRARYAAFSTSPDLRTWQLRRNFDYPDHGLGGIECPDLFEMTADDGSRHWVLGASMDAYGVGLPMTYAYWTGRWDGEQYIADDLTPQWLDWGWDWYAAVTWPVAESPETRRYAIAWMNNWKYANRDVPTDASDGYNGQNSIVRELRLDRQTDGRYSLLSAPVTALAATATRSVALPDRVVDGTVVLPWEGRAYELEVDIAWTTATDMGVSVGRSADGTRHTDIGRTGSEVYVDRSASDLPGYSLNPYWRATAPSDAAGRSIHLRIFVDMQSVEVFADDGRAVLSQQVHFTDGDQGIALHSVGGASDFTGLTFRDLAG
ncbi:glycoside hydrolase family 32 protein [Clavibacter nebraskensis]|uniref:Levan fructotransferase n=2 Tax=Clavibacter nebraskensis TaxID=31963 RepID=A0AAI8ZFK5_9MICO|nr:glycoside hydrolase family 32 protein [Clavibacter nebraskensis]KXU22010.1 glycosyl hydrolase family 32 [Clavibacter nebraskensis]OAH18732.1 glycosyl hydrolase family 32 [Clavibacter nebraskensis]QGV68486.1 glycoside hydrolase family 32 protein [Clavibacter nebraskensis]QGV71277.1 glycoside hydrolase family 32 protein [Clavibacter nebraskensis]UKF28159.1 glycoside hydrolase family 32 protein [Clavibacter nebraskensis]